jgi:hypothetical protein
MKPIKIILQIQLVLGLVGGFFALTAIHSGQMNIAWAYNLRVEFAKTKQSPDYHEAPLVRDKSFAQILDDLEAIARDQVEVAFYGLLTCGVLVMLAAVMLWLLRRATPSNKSLQATAAAPASCD